MKFIKVDDLPNTIFLQGRLVNNIGTARILTRKEKDGMTPGSPDVRIKLINGDSKMVTRNELLERCRDHSGNRIKMSKIKDGREFKVTIPSSDLNTVVGIFHVPSKKIEYRFTVNRKMVDGTVKKMPLPSGHFVVYMFDTEKKVFDRRYPLVVDKKLFDKMFIIAEKNMSSANQRIKSETDKYLAEQKKKEATRVENETKAASKNMSSGGNTSSTGVNKSGQSKLKQSQGPTMLKADANAPYMAVRRIVKAGTFDNVIGYTISDGNKTVDLELSKVMLLCRQKKIRNMCLVRINNKVFLRGVGIKLDTLETTFR